MQQSHYPKIASKIPNSVFKLRTGGVHWLAYSVHDKRLTAYLFIDFFSIQDHTALIKRCKKRALCPRDISNEPEPDRCYLKGQFTPATPPATPPACVIVWTCHMTVQPCYCYNRVNIAIAWLYSQFLGRMRITLIRQTSYYCIRLATPY